VRTAALFLASVAMAGCGSCKDDPKPAVKPAPRTATIPPTARPGGLQMRTPTWKPPAGSGAGPTATMTKLTVDEATPAIPTIPGATVIDAPSAAPHGEQVHLAWCIAAPDQKLALEAVNVGLTESGWNEIHQRGQGARVAISGDRPPYRLTASISASPRPGCSPADGKWFASVAMYKIESVTRPPALDDPGAAEPIEH